VFDDYLSLATEMEHLATEMEQPERELRVNNTPVYETYGDYYNTDI